MPQSDIAFLSQDERASICSRATAKQYGIFLKERRGASLLVQVSHGTTELQLALISQVLEHPILPDFKDAALIEKNVRKHYEGFGVAESVVSHSVADYVEFLLEDAFSQRASDLHIEPFLGKIRLRYRIDGILYEKESLPQSLMPVLSGRLSVLSRVNPTLLHLPQDGSFPFYYHSKNYTVRCSFVPGPYGSYITLRFILKKGEFELSRLGMSGSLRKKLLAALGKSGLFLITGPTNSGKTTTTYALINFLKKEDRKVLTLENPIEYALEDVQQIEVQPEGPLTFREALRSALRQNPDVLFLGEIRDQETAEAAYRAALTGHLVLATLHCENAEMAYSRLLQLGLNDSVRKCLLGILSQKLDPKPCPECTGMQMPCPKCNSTGYFGRQATFFVLS